STFNGSNRVGIARLNPNGSLDSGFDPGTGVAGTVDSVAAWPGGKALIGGTFTSVNSSNRFCMALIDQSGNPDAGFSMDPGPSSSVHTVSVRPEGYVLIGGNFTSYNGVSRIRVARLFGAALLSIRSAGANVVLSWPTNLVGYTLQSGPQPNSQSQ